MISRSRARGKNLEVCFSALFREGSQKKSVIGKKEWNGMSKNLFEVGQTKIDLQ